MDTILFRFKKRSYSSVSCGTWADFQVTKSISLHGISVKVANHLFLLLSTSDKVILFKYFKFFFSGLCEPKK